MLERIQVNSITHPYSSCILLTPPSAHQTQVSNTWLPAGQLQRISYGRCSSVVEIGH